MVEVAAPQLPQVRSVEFLTVVGLVVGLIDPVAMAIEASGRLVVVDRTLNAVVRVHPVKGSASIVSSAAIGAGPPFLSPFGIAVEASGRLMVIDTDLNAVVRVDPVSGNHTIVSDATTGRAPPFLDPRGIAVEATGQLVVVNGFPAAVVRLDPMSGSLTIVSGCAEGDNAGNCVGKIIGRGPLSLTQSYRAIAVEATGQLMVVDSSSRAVVRVDPVSGTRTIVSDATTGRGQSFSSPASIAVEATGQLVVGDTGLNAVVRVDPVSGDRTLVSR